MRAGEAKVRTLLDESDSKRDHLFLKWLFLKRWLPFVSVEERECSVEESTSTGP